VLDLSASLNPVAPDPVPTVAAHLSALRRYPDPSGAEGHLAAVMGVDPDRLVLTNGGSEAIALVAQARPAGWVDEPEFSLYARHLREVREGAPRWRSNPHNPTGRLAGADETAAVWDEAFWPLATGTWTRGDAERGSFVLGSLTKLLACPGVRLGYVLAPNEALIERLARRQPAWSVNGLAAEALPELLAPVDLPSWADSVAALRQELVSLLERHDLRPLPSDANYVLVAGATGLRQRLAGRGVIVRGCTSFGLPDHVRIAVPSAAGLDRLKAALQ
jgi:histidinol-phosphate/aromatic aminotransferase/cobyric acid decarboxylase-like protein